MPHDETLRSPRNSPLTPRDGDDPARADPAQILTEQGVTNLIAKLKNEKSAGTGRYGKRVIQGSKACPCLHPLTEVSSTAIADAPQ
jgi:hypothetical protein